MLDNKIDCSKFEPASQFKYAFVLLQIEAPINVQIRIWFLITAARFELKRRRGIQFDLSSVVSNNREHVQHEQDNERDNVFQERLYHP